jgi:hypothetical protein
MRLARPTALLALAVPLATPVAARARDFPRNFLWGTAISGFQTEAGGRPAHADRGSDWWVWWRARATCRAERASPWLTARENGNQGHDTNRGGAACTSDSERWF